MFEQTQIGSLLHEEHLQTINALQRLEDFLAKQGTKRVPDCSLPEIRKALEGVVAIAHEVSRHFGFEEDELFTLLSAQGEMGMVHLLTGEHAVIKPLAQDLAKDANAALAGEAFSAETWKDFHGRGMELCEREIFHIQKEEMGLLAAISMMVDPEDDARLADLYRRQAA